MNAQIRVPEVSVIDETGKHVGNLPTADALALAQQRGYDLVEIAPMAKPPVCKILDFGAFQFQLEKKERKAKAHQKKVELKGIRLTFKMGPHDRDTRKAQTAKFLEEGHKVQLEMRLRGRENALKDLAKQGMLAFAQDLGFPVTIETALNQAGNRLTMIIGKKR